MPLCSSITHPIHSCLWLAALQSSGSAKQPASSFAILAWQNDAHNPGAFTSLLACLHVQLKCSSVCGAAANSERM